MVKKHGSNLTGNVMGKGVCGGGGGEAVCGWEERGSSTQPGTTSLHLNNSINIPYFCSSLSLS